MRQQINKAKRGPLVGIPGAPAVIAQPLGEDESDWTVCDTATGPTEWTTTVLAAAGTTDRLDPSKSILVAPRSEGASATYLLYNGRRAKVDLRDAAVVRALRLDGIVPRPVSRALLDTVPELPEITAPHIADAGQPGPRSLAEFTVGTVVRATRAEAVDYYVVLADGVQRIGAVAADLIRFSDSQSGREIATVVTRCDRGGAGGRLPAPRGLARSCAHNDGCGRPPGAVRPLEAKRGWRASHHRGTGWRFATAGRFRPACHA